MNATTDAVQITLRVPGGWAHPGELLERLPHGFRLTPDRLILPDGAEMEFSPLPPDDQFPGVFRSSCRRPATADESATVGRYTVNIALSGPGGSMDAAVKMMQAGAAIVRAGGAGVFIDNSALAHGGEFWTELTEDAGPDAVSFAFVCIIAGKQEVRTMGMHVMGFPDVIMRRADLDDRADPDMLIEVIRYICNEVKPIGNGHILCDLGGPRFKATAADADEFIADSPMHNPFGRLRLTSFKELAEGN